MEEHFVVVGAEFEQFLQHRHPLASIAQPERALEHGVGLERRPRHRPGRRRRHRFGSSGGRRQLGVDTARRHLQIGRERSVQSRIDLQGFARCGQRFFSPARIPVLLGQRSPYRCVVGIRAGQLDQSLDTRRSLGRHDTGELPLCKRVVGHTGRICPSVDASQPLGRLTAIDCTASGCSRGSASGPSRHYMKPAARRSATYWRTTRVISSWKATEPAAISRSAVTAGLLSHWTIGSPPRESCRARSEASTTRAKRLGTFSRQSSTVTRANRRTPE